MKIIGFFLIITSWVQLDHAFSMTQLLWLLFGIIIMTGSECLTFLSHTERFIHRSKDNAK